jgi:anti-sigma regulatory factor (Ser/Thr protein kinase)
MKRLLDGFTRFASRRRVPSAVRHNMYVALDELLSNAVKHARPGGRGRMSLSSAVHDGALEVTVRDNGPAFNLLEAPRSRTDQPLMERPIGGLGILLVRELMDDVNYERLDEVNRTVLKKVFAR